MKEPIPESASIIIAVGFIVAPTKALKHFLLAKKETSSSLYALISFYIADINITHWKKEINKNKSYLPREIKAKVLGARLFPRALTDPFSVATMN